MSDNPFQPTPPNATKVATKWALISAGTQIVLTFVFQFLKIAPDSPAKYITIIPAIAFIIMAQIEYRQLLGGSISYGKAFSTGFRVALFSGLIMALFMFIYVSYINHDFVNQTLDAQRAKMSEKGLTDDQIEQAMAITSKMMRPAVLMLIAAISSAFSGAIISLITSAIVKKDPLPFGSQDYVDPTA